MTFTYLNDAALEEVRRAAIDLGFADEQNRLALAAGISRAFVDAFTTGGTGVAKLLTLTSRMNGTRVLLSGEVPLQTWLNNAILLSAGTEEELVFRRALEIVSVDGIAPPTTSPSDAPAAAPTDAAELPRTDGELEITIVEDDTLDVGFLHDGARVSRSVAKLLVPRHFGGVPSTLPRGVPDVGLGTGWLLAPGLLITNFHVMNARLAREPAASDVDFEHQAKVTEVVFDYYRTDSEVCSVPSEGCVAFDRELDYAILRLPTGSVPRQPMRLRDAPIIKPRANPLRERVNVLQHPAGDPMRLGFRNNFVVAGTGDRLSYLTDTAGGSSGSPICDDAWFVAALHRGFQTIPGQPMSVWGKTIRQENYGTPITAILDHLGRTRPDLLEEVASSQGAPK
ncbi:serine protease [Amycolatopsis mediterranei S699]|uniref:Serine protease n=2 Tax=Amycolatopsis mediterranei TaxID=33910 RepID=A0A0H3DAV7_AMYMU|nr:trypsin-like peptidase domain-containing protein [Amycolatopsis mediterranei]ADJ48155.1 serine protease [Amycolatopsis mediterranei U32]AEK45058.1 serine protease [Amycolatopsis mediterranei S699]AFO79866.1 serine protease [Amycolatopsis mediterranei S699]AGT86994.1 serine protease [Amycolatopsis mediterranei RB]KDO10640.1 serine protease [Amycolatopsis mediterranei]